MFSEPIAPKPITRAEYDPHRDALMDVLVAEYKRNGRYRDEFGKDVAEVSLREQVRDNAIRAIMRIAVNFPYYAITATENIQKQEQRIELLRAILDPTNQTPERRDAIKRSAISLGISATPSAIYKVLSRDADLATQQAQSIQPCISSEREIGLFAEALDEELRKGIPLVCDRLTQMIERNKGIAEEREKARRDTEAARRTQGARR